MRKLSGIVLLSTLVAAMLPDCAGSPNAPGASSGAKTAVLLRTYFVSLRPDVPLGKAHPPLDRFEHSGYLPGGQPGKDQLRALADRFTLNNLAYQYSDTLPLEEGKEAVLEMGFGEAIQVKAADLAEAGGGALTTDITITFARRELFKRKLAFKPGDCILFAGHLDPSLPILSVFTLEIRRFPADQTQAYQEFLLQSRRDAEAFAPPAPQQHDQEPYLPGVGDVSMPELVSRKSAAYPDAAKPERQEAQVIVEVVVDKEGRATRPHILTPPSIFDASALEAAATYRYKPAMKNGQPVSVTMNIIIIFKYTMQPT